MGKCASWRSGKVRGIWIDPTWLMLTMTIAFRHIPLALAFSFTLNSSPSVQIRRYLLLRKCEFCYPDSVRYRSFSAGVAIWWDTTARAKACLRAGNTSEIARNNVVPWWWEVRSDNAIAIAIPVGNQRRMLMHGGNRQSFAGKSPSTRPG
jgi:hypothetical protein